MKYSYPFIFTLTDKAILIEVPDFKILSASKDIKDAIEMAKDAIGRAGIALEERKEDIPKATDIINIDVEKGTFSKEGESYLSFVDIDFIEYRKKLGVHN